MSWILYRIVRIIFGVMELALLVRAFISWLPVPREHRLVRLLYQITEPILAPIRSLIQRSSFGHNMILDISPIIALILIAIVRTFILSLIR
ncbi:MAG: YggT family protein [Clostridiaceae bacterium]